jgi:hypothetical protein
MRNLILASATCALFASAGASAQTFKFTTLDNPGDPTFNQLLGINDDGTIVGYFGSGAIGHPNIGYEISAPYTEYVSRNQPASLQTQATGINNAGLTTGFWSDTNNGTDNNFAVLFEPIVSRLASISVVDPLVAFNMLPNTPAFVSQALGINNDDVVAGFYVDGSGNSHGYTYSVKTAAYTPVKIGGATSDAATGINDNGQVSGFYLNSKGDTVGFVKNSTGGVVTSFRVPGTTFTQLLGINNSGTAVGFYNDSNNVPHGLYYTPANGAWTKVNDPDGVQGTVVNGINNKNQLVGFYIDAAGNFHGMIVDVTP